MNTLTNTETNDNQPIFNVGTDNKLDKIINYRNKITDKMLTQVLRSNSVFQNL